MAATNVTKASILIVEDESIVALDIQQRLGGLGYRVVGVVDTGERAIRTAETARPELVLMDIKLKGKMDGIQAAEVIRTRLDLPIIFLTAFADEATLQRATVTESFGYILKPFEERELAIHIEMALHKHQLERKLRESEERYSLAVQGANDGIWDWNLKTGAVYFSPRWKAMLEFADADLAATADTWFQLLHPDDSERFQLDLSNHLAGRTTHFQTECRLRTKTGAYRWMLTRGVAVRDAEGVPYRMAGSQADVTERKQAEDQLIHDALHDTLTGLPNRALFLDRLEGALERARRHAQHAFAVLFLDLDRFKIVNDSLGHQQGDRVLVELARRLHQLLRPTDTVARLGGDEFVILLDELADPQDAELVAKRIQEEVKQPFELDGQAYFVSASIGIVPGAARYERAEDILQDADMAMYRAKADGKARYALFDPAMRERAITRLELEGDLRLALNRQQFEVHYQPILSLQTGAVSGFEALLRWFHPVRGTIAPADFIPVAEETGAILAIGRWVLGVACRQLRQWHRRYPCEPPLTMSVNISGRQFIQPTFFEQLQQTLQETGLDPQTLKLEITESLFMGDSKIVLSTLHRVRALGVQLAIDDFGTGFSSLGYVQHFPIQTIKIDRAFIRQMGEPGKHAGLAHTIVHMANELGLGTIAEGIETVEQLAQLKAMACEAGQGWLFSKALSPEDLEAYLARAFTAPR